jgi:aromatic-amino-acid transaminase
MFSVLPLSGEQVLRLREEHGIYMAGSGRINVAGLTTANIDKFVADVAAVSG